METQPPEGDVDRSTSYSDPHRSIPDYLQPFIVDQDPSRYTAIDQAVWRFVLLQLQHRLERTAHPSYTRGLAQSGISSERIPSIEQMNRALEGIGWQAVCVDGFIPPRAFQAFQAMGVLPIAAEIRTPEHLPYTPAPDIIHEAAGHAPILIDARYAAYVRAVGDVGARAFSSPADARVDQAVRLLSDLKQGHSDKPSDIRAAELELEQAVATLGEPSEAARVARLYWWTAEYGLVGTPKDYRLYGAGLLSSLGESHFCHRPEVTKTALTPDCTRVGYDITQPQPQLFVARDFEHLHAVLDEVSQTLAYDIGGNYAVQAALLSREPCSVYLPGGTQVIGTLSAAEGEGTGLLLGFEAGASLAHRGRFIGQLEQAYFVPVGRLADGTDPRQLESDVLAPERDPRGYVTLKYASGLHVSGKASRGLWHSPEPTLWLTDVQLEWPDRAPIRLEGPYPLLLAERVVTAGAGSACPEVSPLGKHARGAGLGRRTVVPKPRAASPTLARLEQLYAATAHTNPSDPRAAARLGTVHAEIEASFPHEWLLRWKLLECLTQLGAADSELGRKLHLRLEELEIYHGGKHPIALGLDYLTSQASRSPT